MNYIMTNKYNQIVGIVLIGGEPEPPHEGYVYEIDYNDIPENVINDLSSYTYDGNEFENIPLNELKQFYIAEYKMAKINSMSLICNSVITHGIDIKNEHYSLTIEDQFNIMRLGLQADDPDNINKLIYHPDNKPFREYTNEEMSFLYHKSITWIEYNTIYFNLLKQVITKSETVDDFLNLKYNTRLPDEYQEQLENFVDISLYNFNILEINDSFDYSNIIPKIDITKNIEIYEREMQ